MVLELPETWILDETLESLNLPLNPLRTNEVIAFKATKESILTLCQNAERIWQS